MEAVECREEILASRWLDVKLLPGDAGGVTGGSFDPHPPDGKGKKSSVMLEFDANVGGVMAGGVGPLDDRQFQLVVETLDALMAIGLEPNSAAPRDRRPAPVAAGQRGPEERHGVGGRTAGPRRRPRARR